MTGDVPTDETVRFVLRVVTPGERVLEVGAGDGAVARALAVEGCRVVAIDADAAAVERARARGADARVATWPAFDDGPFDAVLFTRSLHHARSLGDAVDRAAAVLAPDGRVVAEEFDHEAVTPDAVVWLHVAANGLVRDGVIDPGHDLLAVTSSWDRWRADHDPDHLQGGEAMCDALRRSFQSVTSEAVPYLYRYLAAAGAEGDTLRRAIAAERRFYVDRGSTPPGRRIVATNPR